MVKKQLIAALLSVILLVSALPLVYAETETSLYSLATTSLVTTIGFADGKAVANAKCTVAPGQTARTSVSLQKLFGSQWVTIEVGMGQGRATTSVTLESGASYRAYGYSTVYDADGNQIDTIYGYSKPKTN